jgi:hypothetical protein
MSQTENAALLKRCVLYVQELADIYESGGTKHSHLLDADQFGTARRLPLQSLLICRSARPLAAAANVSARSMTF